MQSRILTYAVGISAFVALASPLQLYAGDEENRSCSFQPEIITFDAPHASKGPGAVDCFNFCPGTEPYNNNIWGAITGYYETADNLFHGFLRSPGGAITEFDAPGAGTMGVFQQGTWPASINWEGAIAGYYQDNSNVFHGFVRNPDGTFVTFDAPGAVGAGANEGTIASVINGVGEVAGWYYNTDQVFHAFLRSPKGTFTEFDAPGAGTGPFQGTVPGGPSGDALNDLGAVAGGYSDAGYANHGFVRAPDGKIQTFDVPGAVSTFGGGPLNLEGAIAAFYFDSSQVVHGYIRAANGTFTKFDAPGAGSMPFDGTYAAANNDFGAVAGFVVDNGNVSHGFVRFPSGRITVFDVKAAGTGNGQGTTPWEINLWGEIVGVYTDANNVNHGFIRGPDLCQ